MAFLDETGGLALSKKILGSTVLMFGGIDTTTPISSISPISTTDSDYSVSKIKWNNNAKYFVYALDGKFYNNFGDPSKVNCGDTYQTYGATTIIPKTCLYYNTGNKRLYYWNGSSFDQLTDTNTTYDRGEGLILSSKNVFSLNVATANSKGGFKTGYQASGKNYPVQLDSNEKAYVNVPWTDNNTNTTYSFADGNNGSFTVTPSGGNAQTVSIGKPSTAGIADKVSNCIQINLNGSVYQYDGSVQKQLKIDTLTVQNGVNSLNTRVSTLENTVSSALVYKGTINDNEGLKNIIGENKAKIGYCYIVTAAFAPDTERAAQINNSTKNLEKGDMIICRTNYSASSNTVSKQTFDVLQANTNNAITGSGTSTSLAVFSGANTITNAPTKGSATKPIYLNNGVPTAINYTIEKSVPSNAVFTDTTYGTPSTTSKGVVKLVSNTTLENTVNNVSSVNGRTYAVQLNTNGAMVVNVPWVNTTYSSITTNTINSWF